MQERMQKQFSHTSSETAKRMFQVEIAKIAVPSKTHRHEAAKDFLDMAQRYYSDALDFQKKGNLVTAFAALNYAHGWLDAGARLGLFDVGHNSKLFTVD